MAHRPMKIVVAIVAGALSAVILAWISLVVLRPSASVDDGFFLLEIALAVGALAGGAFGWWRLRGARQAG